MYYPLWNKLPPVLRQISDPPYKPKLHHFHSFIYCRHLYSASSSGATQKRSQPQSYMHKGSSIYDVHTSCYLFTALSLQTENTALQKKDPILIHPLLPTSHLNSKHHPP